MGVVQYPAGSDGGIRRAVLVNIEIPGKECGEVAAEFVDFPLYEFGAFHTCLCADMIHMQVEEQEFAA